MEKQTQEVIERFDNALQQCTTVKKFRALSAKVENDPNSLKALKEMEMRMPLNNLIALQQLRDDYSHDLLICDYLDARAEVIQLLQQVNKIISSQIRINIGASLQPASCCG